MRERCFYHGTKQKRTKTTTNEDSSATKTPGKAQKIGCKLIPFLLDDKALSIILSEAKDLNFRFFACGSE
jgi:hypothetical protein